MWSGPGVPLSRSSPGVPTMLFASAAVVSAANAMAESKVRRMVDPRRAEVLALYNTAALVALTSVKPDRASSDAESP